MRWFQFPFQELFCLWIIQKHHISSSVSILFRKLLSWSAPCQHHSHFFLICKHHFWNSVLTNSIYFKNIVENIGVASYWYFNIWCCFLFLPLQTIHLKCSVILLFVVDGCSLWTEGTESRNFLKLPCTCNVKNVFHVI